MMIFMYFGEMMLFKNSFNLLTAPMRDEKSNTPMDPMVLDTI